MGHTLAVGDAAPAFETTDIFGRSVSLESFKGKPLLMAFMRYAGCPFCNLAMHRLVVEHRMLMKEDCQVVAFVQSSSENIKLNIYDRHLEKPAFPIIADPDRLIYNQYGVRLSAVAAARSITKIPYWLHSVRDHGYKQTKIDGKFFLVPAMFLVGARSQTIITADYSSSFYDHTTFADIYEKLNFREVEAI